MDILTNTRWDFIGLSTDAKPTPATSKLVVDGSTYYEADTSKLYVYCKNNWYERKALGSGGGGPTVVQTTGTSTTDVMSQDATTKMIYPDIANNPHKMVIGEGSIDRTNKGLTINGVIGPGLNGSSIAIGVPDGNVASVGNNGRANGSVAIGNTASVGRGMHSIAIGYNSYTNSGQDTGDNVAIGSSAYAGNASATSTVALGAYAKTTRTGEVNVGAGTSGTGYNSTNYRVIGGVHDGVDAHDALTVGQANALIDAINSALNTNIPHIGS